MLGGSPLAWLNNHGRPVPISATLGQTCAGAEGGQVRGQRGEFSGRGRFGRIGRVKGRPRLGGVRGASAQGKGPGRDRVAASRSTSRALLLLHCQMARALTGHGSSESWLDDAATLIKRHLTRCVALKHIWTFT